MLIFPRLAVLASDLCFARLDGQVLAAFLPIQTLQQFLDQWGYPVVFCVCLVLYRNFRRRRWL